MKNIKSRTYHRLFKTDKLKASLADLEADPEASKDSTMKLESKRAEERMTLKHKSNLKWVSGSLSMACLFKMKALEMSLQRNSSRMLFLLEK